MPSPFSKGLFTPQNRSVSSLSFSTRPNRQYLSRNRYTSGCKQSVDEYQLFTPYALLWGFLFLFAPISYVYIGMVLMRELFGEYLLRFGQNYAPLLHQWTLASAISNFQHSKMPHDMVMGHDFAMAMDDGTNATVASYTIPNILESMTERTPRMWLWMWIEVWCYLEALFYILIKIRIRWLRGNDPLEASFRAAPMMDVPERRELWRRMQECEDGSVSQFISGWFFDRDCQEISAYDVRDFVAWSMFEGRHQEHLTENELTQLEDFVDELQYRISLELYGTKSDACFDDDDTTATEMEQESGLSPPEWKLGLPRPRKHFRFPAGHIHDEESNFFTNLFEQYRHRYDSMEFRAVKDLREMVQKAAGDNFDRVKDFQKKIAETAHSIAEAEAMAAASLKASKLYETIVPIGSVVDKQLHATYEQMNQAWDAMKAMKDQRRLETARFLSKQRQRLEQQMTGYRVMLNRMLQMSSGVPSRQMASLMRRITECYEAMENLEGRAQAAFTQFTGFAMKNTPFFAQGKKEIGFAKYSADPIMNVSTFPLFFHLLLLGGTELPLRVMMRTRGFKRKTIGNVDYYYHPGIASTTVDGISDNDKLPVVFVHGIGIGLIVYMNLIDKLLQSGRPIYLPEIPYVSGFRPWQSSTAVLPPAVVSSTMVAMLASHGHLSAAWLGHSYGTSWLSYMTKFAPETVSALLFLDPICFCLHLPRLTKSFVYTQADIGTISYILRTDAIVRHTIQRSFPWSRIILFAEQINVPCHVFLSDEDSLVPSARVADYLGKKNVPIHDFDETRSTLLASREMEPADACPFGLDKDSVKHMRCIRIRGDQHGGWTEKPRYSMPLISYSAELLCKLGEQSQKIKGS